MARRSRRARKILLGWAMVTTPVDEPEFYALVVNPDADREDAWMHTYCTILDSFKDQTKGPVKVTYVSVLGI
jgi:hypothetical protein